MSISNDGTGSQISYSATTRGQIRYKKALKEISKLVSMNTILKKQVEAVSQNYKKLEIDYINLSEQYEEVITKFNKLSNSSPLYPVSKNIFDLKQDINHNPGGNRRVNERQQITNEEVLVDFDIENMSTSQIKLSQNDTKIRIQKFDEKIQILGLSLHEKDQLIQQLRLNLQKKNIQMNEMQRKVKELMIKLSKATKEGNQTEKSLTVQMSEELMNERKKVQVLENKLAKAENWTAKITSEYENLKKRVMLNQGLSFGSNLRMPHVLRFNQIQTSMNVGNKKGVQMHNEEIEELRRQYGEKKKKYRAQIHNLKQQLEDVKSFIQKQQFYIQNCVHGNIQPDKAIRK